MRQVWPTLEQVNDYETVVDDIDIGWCLIHHNLLRHVLQMSREGYLYPYRIGQFLRRWSTEHSYAYKIDWY